MFAKLALKNVRKSFKDYIVYFLTLMLSVTVFFVFNSLDAPSKSLALTKNQLMAIEMMGEGIEVLSVVISVVMGFLIIYANGFMIRRRKKELATYMLLGMSKRKVSLILSLETFFVGILSLAFGILLGILTSQGVTVLIANYLEVELKGFTFVFSFSTLIDTVKSFGIIFLTVMIFNVVSISRYKLIDLINANKVNQKLKNKKTWVNILLFLTSVTSLGIAYHIVLKDGIIKILDGRFPYCLVLGVIGVVLLFMSLSGFFLTLSQKNKKLYYRNLNMFSIRQISNKINTTHISMSVVSLLIFVALVIMPSMYVVSSSVSTSVSDKDIIINAYKRDTNKQADTFTEALKSKNISDDSINEFYDQFSRKTEYSTLRIKHADSEQDNLFPPEQQIWCDYFDMEDGAAIDDKINALCYTVYVRESDFNRICEELGMNKNISLNNNEFIVVGNFDEIELDNRAGNYIEHLLKKLTDENMKFKSLEKVDVGMDTSRVATVVPDDFADKYLEKSNEVIFIGELKKDKRSSQKRVDDILVSSLHDDYLSKEKSEYYIRYFSRINTLIEYKISIFFIIAMGVYVGIIFLLAGAAILALQQLSEAGDNFERYQLLRKFGTERKMMKKSVLSQATSHFILPLLVAIINASVGIAAFMKTFNESSVYEAKATDFVAPFGIMVIIYLSYFLLTYFGCSRILQTGFKRKKEKH